MDVLFPFNFRWQTLIFATLAMMAGRAAAADQTKGLSLKESVEYAIAHSPTVASAKLELENARLALETSRAAFLPTLDLTAGSQIRKDLAHSELNAATGANAGLTLKENLFRNGLDQLGRDIAERNVALAEVSYRLASETLALDVIRAFYGLGQVRAGLVVDREQYDILVKQFNDLARQYRQGLKPKNDYLRFNARVQEKKIAIGNAEREAARQRFELLAKLGVSPQADEAKGMDFAVPKPEMKAPPLPTGKLDLDKTHAMTVQSVKLALQDLERRKARRQTLPSLDLSTSVGHSESETRNELGAYDRGRGTTWDVTLSLNYTLWDWGTKRRELEQTINTLQIQSNQLAQEKLELAATLQRVSDELKSQSASLKLSRELLEMESSNYQFLEQEYRRGAISYLDLIEALTSFMTAKTQYAQAYFSYLTNLAGYRFYEGTIDAWIQEN